MSVLYDCTVDMCVFFASDGRIANMKTNMLQGTWWHGDVLEMDEFFLGHENGIDRWFDTDRLGGGGCEEVEVGKE